MNTITLNINGKDVKTQKGKTVLEAALDNGIYIPTLCYHPDLSPFGACRLCIVQIDGIRGLPTSCTTAVKEGMVVKTDTSEILNVAAEKGYLLIAADIRGKEMKLSKKIKDKRIILAIGYEAEGLSKELTYNADLLVRIDHTKKVDSLNAAVAGSILMSRLHG